MSDKYLADLSARKDELERILRAGGDLILEGYTLSPGADTNRTKILSTETKSSAKDLVTFYDKAVENLMMERFAKSFPGEKVVGEETVAASKLLPRDVVNNAPDAFWLLDPIDGTTNFSRAYPFFCTTAAFVVRKGKAFDVLVGGVFNPVSGEMFLASKGGGAWVNGQKLSVTPVEEPVKALFTTGFASERASSGQLSFKLFTHLTKETLGVRRDGSAALDLAYVAAGRIDAYWEWGLSPWDIAAGVCLVKEAQGQVTSLANEDFDFASGEILATNGKLHKWLQNRIKDLQNESARH